MLIEGTLFKGSRIMAQSMVRYIEPGDIDAPASVSDAEATSADAGTSAKLESCLRTFCKLHDAPLPLWLEKNTREYVNYRQTSFEREQFLEKVPFDSMQIRQIE